MMDGPQGVADRTAGVTAFPSALTVVASFSRASMRAFAAAQAVEQRVKGSMVMLGPMVNLARVPLDGRAFESFGEDAYLAAIMVNESVRGIQGERVIANVKHFVRCVRAR